MSRENLEVTRKAIEAINRRDRDAWLALQDPEVELVPASDWPEGGTIRGRDAVWDFVVAVDETWEPSPFELSELTDAGADKVVSRLRRKARGKSSGADTVFDLWFVSTLRNGTVLRTQFFRARGEALQAGGLKE
jgi:ketosteroid isomerase-like protein